MLSLSPSSSPNSVLTFPQTWYIWVSTQFNFGRPLRLSPLMFGVAESCKKQVSLMGSVFGARSTCPNSPVVSSSRYLEKLFIFICVVFCAFVDRHVSKFKNSLVCVSPVNEGCLQREYLSEAFQLKRINACFFVLSFTVAVSKPYTSFDLMSAS